MSDKAFDHSQNMDYPLVSFLLLTYDAEPFVKDAVSSALWQKYNPSEIVISDDASTDKTYEIVQTIVDSYDGPPQVVANQIGPSEIYERQKSVLRYGILDL